MKFCTSVTKTKQTIKNSKLGTNGLEIEAKRKNYTTLDAKRISNLFCSFLIYTQIVIFIAALRI